MSDRCSQVLEEVHREILALVRRTAARDSGAAPRLLDVGCWDGGATLRYAAAVRGTALGIEIFDRPAAQARARGVEVARLDLERDAFPWPDACVDLVIANQVLEHLKNVWHPMSQMFRVLAPGGTLVVSVPNLSSLHNRALLALGRQPTSIRTRGPHVRGFTAREIRSFVALGGALEAVRLRGVGFYPLPARWSGPLATLWPGGSHTVIVAGVKRRSTANPWREVLESEQVTELQTYFA